MLTHHRREFHYWPPPPQSQILICCKPISFRKLFIFSTPDFSWCILIKEQNEDNFGSSSWIIFFRWESSEVFFLQQSFLRKSNDTDATLHFWIFRCKKQTFWRHFNQIWFTHFGVIFLLLAAMYCYVGSGENLCTVQRWNLKCKPGDEWAQWRI